MDGSILLFFINQIITHPISTDTYHILSPSLVTLAVGLPTGRPSQTGGDYLIDIFEEWIHLNGMDHISACANHYIHSYFIHFIFASAQALLFFSASQNHSFVPYVAHWSPTASVVALHQSSRCRDRSSLGCLRDRGNVRAVALNSGSRAEPLELSARCNQHGDLGTPGGYIFGYAVCPSHRPLTRGVTSVTSVTT